MEQIHTISEVSTFTGINESTLRNWEREFIDYLTVSRDYQGARIYTHQHIEQFKIIQLLRKKGLSIGVIKNLLSAFQNKPNIDMALQVMNSHKKSSTDATLEVATTTELTIPNIDLNIEQLKVFSTLQIFQKTMQQLPEQIKNIVQNELQSALLEHCNSVTQQLDEIMESRLEKYRKQKKPWWKMF